MKTLIAAAAIFFVSIAAIGRSAETANVSGKWHFVLNTEGGDRAVDSKFEQDGDKVGGKWGVDAKGGTDIKGTFTENKLMLEFPFVSDEIGPGTMKIRGKLADDGSLTGEWSFQDYSGAFTATRAKDETK